MSDLTPPEIARPDTDSARMVQQSVKRLSHRELELTEGFYGHLFAMLPEVRSLFPEDMAEQRVRLLKALLSSIDALHDTLHDPSGMEARLQALGEIHYHRGISDDQYQYVGHALIRTVRDVLPGDWSTWLSSAWISVCSWMIQHMVVGAQRARAQAESGVPGATFHAAQARYSGLLAAQTGAIPVLASAASRAFPQAALSHGGQAYPGHEYAGQEYAGHEYAGQEYAGQEYAGRIDTGVGYGWQERAGQGYQAQAYSGQEHAGQGYSQQSYAGQEFRGQEYGQQGYGEQAYVQHGYAGQGHPQQEYAGQEYAGREYAGQEYAQQGYAGQAYVGQAYVEQAYVDQAYVEQTYAGQGHRQHGYAQQTYAGQSHPQQEYAAQFQSPQNHRGGDGASGGAGSSGEVGSTGWVHYPQLSELGHEPPATKGSPVLTGPLALVQSPVLAAPEPDSLGLAGAVATVFPRRRRGAGLV